jgi:hypothetical protein
MACVSNPLHDLERPIDASEILLFRHLPTQLMYNRESRTYLYPEAAHDVVHGAEVLEPLHMRSSEMDIHH